MTEEEKKRRMSLNQYIMHGHPVQTFSSQNPPYCYTELCPDPSRRKGKPIWKGSHNDYGISWKY